MICMFSKTLTINMDFAKESILILNHFDSLSPRTYFPIENYLYASLYNLVSVICFARALACVA